MRNWLAQLFLTGLMLLAAIDIAAAQPKRVLMLHSFGPNFGPWNAISARLREELRKVEELSGHEQSREGRSR